MPSQASAPRSIWRDLVRAVILAGCGVAAIWLVIAHFIDAPPPAPPRPVQVDPQEAAKNLRFTREMKALWAIRETMKNPDSFKLSRATRPYGQDALCVTYRGTNSFNAIVPAQAVLVGVQLEFQQHARFDADWSRYCAKGGEDVAALLSYALDYYK